MCNWFAWWAKAHCDFSRRRLPQRVDGTKASAIGSAFVPPFGTGSEYYRIRRHSGGAVHRSEQPRGWYSVVAIYMSRRPELLQNGVYTVRRRYYHVDGDTGGGDTGDGRLRARYARGIGGSKEWMGSAVGSSENMLFEVCRALYPTNLLHVGRPGVLATPCGLDSKREERNGVSENCKASGECDRRNQINCETHA